MDTWWCSGYLARSLGTGVDFAASLGVLAGCLICQRFILTFSLRSQYSVLVVSVFRCSVLADCLVRLSFFVFFYSISDEYQHV